MCESTKEKLAEHDSANNRLLVATLSPQELKTLGLMFNLKNASYAVESLMGLLHDSYVYRQFEGHKGDYKDCPAEICRSFRNMVAEWNKAVQ